MLIKVTLCLTLVVTLINITFAENTRVGPTSSGSVFSSLLQSLSSSDSSPNCPGRCFNAIAALACQETLDTPGLCRKTGYRCCKNIAEKESSEVQAVTTATSKSPVSKEGSVDEAKEETMATPITKGIKTLRYSNDGTKEDKTDKKEDNSQTIKGKNDEELTAADKIDEDEIVPQLYSSSAHSVEVCPGVCVAQRISNFCEAVIDVEGLCKPQLRCCVPAKLFDGVDIPPKEFKVLNAAESSNVTLEESRSDMTDLPKFETSVTTPSTTSRETTTEKKRAPVTEKMKVNMDKVPLMEEDDGIPPEKRCTGTCIAGFFAFLCDSIDRTRECAGGGKCCIAPRKTKPGKNDKKEVIAEQPSEQSPQKSTTKKPKVQTTTRTTTPKPRTTTPKPRTTTTERETTVEEQPPPCAGNCLPVEIASRCQHPSRLVASSGCNSDEICCEGKGKSPVKSPVSQVPEAFGTLLSLFGGGQPEKRPPPPPPSRTAPPVTITTTAPTTTTMPTTVVPVTERPECTGTCISPILSFTCFGNAEMSDLFKCSKDKQSCCATKSAIRDLTRKHEMRNVARNDTVFPSEDAYYHLPSTVVRPPHSYSSEDDYHNSFYNYPSQEHVPFKPPPPPPSYQSSVYAQQSFDKSHMEHNIYTPYGQPHHVPPPQPPQPPMNPHTHSGAYIKPPHTNPIPPPQSTHIGQLQPHYNHDLDDRQQPYLPTKATMSQDVAPASSSQVHFLGGSPHVENKYVCGVKGTNRVARVVGGEDAVPGEWCWQVALINSLNQYLCGGALIGTQWVLTAAHCVTNIVRSGDAIYVRVGDHDLTTRFGSPGAQTLPVATTYIHHNHNSQTLDNDIALLKLSSHAELGNGVCLACLPARGVSQVAGKRCTVTGYGYMGETGPIPLRVREAEIPVVSDNECVRKINAVTEKIFILPASSFCAGGESGHDACQGDGGGPLVCNVDGYFELSGLVSWGFGCGRQDVPGVYVKVSSFIGWVNQIISVNNL